MPKKYTNKAARATYISILWGVALFGISYRLEGWDMGDVSNLFNHPIGIGSLVLVVITLVLFVINLRSKDLRATEKVKKREARLPLLRQLRKKIKAYMRKSYLLLNDDSLYRPDNCGLGDNPSIAKLFTLSEDNKTFLQLSIQRLGSLREDIEQLSTQLQSNKLEKLLLKAFQAEYKAKCQLIAVRLYKTRYTHTDRNELRLLKSEGKQLTLINVKKLGKSLRRLYDYLELLEGGKDIDDNM